MNKSKINAVLDQLKSGDSFRTPDIRVGVPFKIFDVTPNEIYITLNSGNKMVITREAFFTANTYLQSNGHNIQKPAKIGSSNKKANSGDLCSATRDQNRNIRCINYIVPILTKFDFINFSGKRPNTCWFV